MSTPICPVCGKATRYVKAPLIGGMDTCDGFLHSDGTPLCTAPEYHGSNVFQKNAAQDQAEHEAVTGAATATGDDDLRSCKICGLTVDLSKGHIAPDPTFSHAGRGNGPRDHYGLPRLGPKITNSADIAAEEPLRAEIESLRTSLYSANAGCARADKDAEMLRQRIAELEAELEKSVRLQREEIETLEARETAYKAWVAELRTIVQRERDGFLSTLKLMGLKPRPGARASFDALLAKTLTDFLPNTQPTK